MSNPSDSALAKPFRTVYSIIGGVFDAFYYFFATLLNPGNNTRINSTRSSRSSGNGSGSGSGPRIGTIHRFRGSAPNMNVGCRSCQM